MMDWSVVSGIGVAVGIPALGALNVFVRMENRVTQLEKDRASDQEWRVSLNAKLDDIAKDLNRLIGARQAP
jgi:hypothetical protein